MNTIVHDSPVGPLTLTSDEGKLISVEFERRSRSKQGARKHRNGSGERTTGVRDPTLDAARKQLDAYFAGRLKSFDLPLAPRGTDFQRQVWKALTRIPYGETTSYGAIARQVGEPGAARAVGAANGANPICIIVPCHRVIGADGSLTGFGGGLDRKRFLLSLERGEGVLFEELRPLSA
jgi:methylated-DNA-[protein]-cysteine S-methyltransferase